MRGGLAIAVVIIVACGGRQQTEPPWLSRQRKLDEMDQRLTQIRQWRHERRIPAEVPPSEIGIWLPRPVTQAKNACPAEPVVPKSCGDICTLSDDICDNAEAICALADELGKDDTEGQARCGSGKASCHDAKQRCCDCAATAAKDAAP
jgi:hypothetical protein